MLPLGPGCQTMTGLDVVNAIDMIKPSYFIPIHYDDFVKEQFIALYSIAVGNCGCELLDLAYFGSIEFNI